MDPKKWREKEGLTLVELAKKLGLRSAGHLSDVERGIKNASGSIVTGYYRISNKVVTPSDFQGAQ